MHTHLTCPHGLLVFTHYLSLCMSQELIMRVYKHAFPFNMSTRLLSLHPLFKSMYVHVIDISSVIGDKCILVKSIMTCLCSPFVMTT